MVKMEADVARNDAWVTVEGDNKNVLKEFFVCFELFLVGLELDRNEMAAFRVAIGNVCDDVLAEAEE